MKKFLFVFIKTVSLMALVVVVFLTNVYTNLFKKSTKVKNSEGNERFFANAFGANTAFADVPAGGGAGSDSDCDSGDSGDC